MIMSKLFINRKKELQKLTEGLQRGNSYILIAPRRYGKTALANKVLDEIAQNKDYMVIKLDFMTYSGGSVRSVAEGIIEKILNSLGIMGKLRRMWMRMDVTLNLKFKYKDLQIEPLLHMFREGDEWALLEEAVELAERVAKREKKKLVVFYDEFAELHSLGERVIKVFRSIIQHQENVSYLFAGSQETIMNKIFVDYSGAFYRFGELIYLKELDNEDIYKYITEVYTVTKENVLDEYRIIDEIIGVLKGHPYYTAQVIEYLNSNTKSTFEEFYQFLYIELLERERAYLNQQILRIKKRMYAIDVLRIIALELNAYEELKIIPRQTINKVLRYLEDAGQIRKEARGSYTITDPLLSLLLLND
jgi:hypothetical protein